MFFDGPENIHGHFEYHGYMINLNIRTNAFGARAAGEPFRQ